MKSIIDQNIVMKCITVLKILTTQEDQHTFPALQETADQACDESQESCQADEEDGPDGKIWGDKW
jgi:hypothetical protein